MTRVLFMILFFLVVAVGLFLFEQKDKLPIGKVAGIAESANPMVGNITKSTTNVVQSAGQNLAQSFAKLPQAATPGGEKIQLNDAAKQIQAQIEKLPSSIAERARYDYCRQVITDYEREHPNK